MHKRGVSFKDFLVVCMIVLSALSFAAIAIPYAPPCLTPPGGVQICGLCYDCGVLDGVCPEHYGKNCADPDCTYGYIYGFVDDNLGNPLEDVQIEVINPGIPAGFYLGSTDSSGYYNLTVPGGFFYDVIASLPLYEPKVDNATVAVDENVRMDFTLSLTNSLCKADCTRINNICDSDCDFWNGCRFDTTIAKLSCDGRPRGFVVDAGGQDIVCCEGRISSYESTIQPRLIADAENTLTTMIPALLGGKKVRVIVAVMEKG